MLEFRCYECGYTKWITKCEDPTTSTGCCKGCGGPRWGLYDMSGNLIG